MGRQPEQFEPWPLMPRGVTMKNLIKLVLLSGTFWVCFLSPSMLFAQQCQDEEGIAKDYVKDLNDAVEAARKESLEEFEKAYHQKSTISKLGLTLGMVNEVKDCLDKATQDSTATKEQVDAYKAQQETYSKLIEKIEADQKALKAAGDPKAAKALIEKFDYSQ
jgi:hypothetical protein